MSFANFCIGRRIRIPGQGIGKVTAVTGNWGVVGVPDDQNGSVTATLCSPTDIRVLTATVVTLTPGQFAACHLIRPVYGVAGAVVGYFVDDDDVGLG